MRAGAAFFLALALSGGTALPPLAGPMESAGSAGRARSPRSPYLLRQIFGDLSLSAPSVWGVAPGVRRREIPEGADLGEEVGGPGSPTSFLKEVSGRATVTFVFDGPGADALLDHITVTVFQAPHITPRAVAAHLVKIYGPEDPSPPGEGEGLLVSWQKGAVLLRYFRAARFFEVTLSAPRPAP